MITWFSLRSGKWTVSNSSGPIVDGLFVFMICCHMPLTANPFLYDLCGLSLSPTFMIYIYIYINDIFNLSITPFTSFLMEFKWNLSTVNIRGAKRQTSTWIRGSQRSAVLVCRRMNGFSANKTTVLLDFRPLSLHSALLQASMVFYAATLLAEFGVCNVLKHLGVWTCCPFRWMLAGAQGSFGAISLRRLIKRLLECRKDWFILQVTGCGESVANLFC